MLIRHLRRWSRFLALALPLLLVACAPLDRAPSADWAIAIHGGAGVSPPLTNADEYAASLERALEIGRDILAEGGTSLDAVTAVVVDLENDPLFNAGRGAVLTNEERCELDASIMNGADLQCGAVASVTNVKSPILLARKVMTDSRHVFFTGNGAEAFAKEQGFSPVPNEYFQTERRKRSLQRAKEREQAGVIAPSGEPGYRGTVGAVALDSDGNLAAATSTGGLTNKRFGRVGDSPVIGAGTYADNASCAVSCTGTGELYIRHGISRALAARLEFGGQSLSAAANALIFDVLPHDSGGLIAVDHRGRIAMPYNTPGMHRGCADANGRFEISIFEEPIEVGGEVAP